MLCNTGVKFASLIVLLGACATGASPEPQLTEQIPATIANAPARPATPTLPTASFSLPPFESSGHEALDAWRNDFAMRAIEAGRNPMVVYEVLRDAKPLEAYLPSDPDDGSSDVSSQAEFAKPVWEYLATAVSPANIDTGATRKAEETGLFGEIEERFGVDGEVVAAIWGMETSFGGYIGTFDGPETLINMATEGRRRKLAETELLATMELIEQGRVRRDQLIAGWAGAMGQTQFMPTTFKAYAIDFSGGNQPDLWTSRADALGSAANYISQSGYRHNVPWGIEIALPEGFDLIYSDGRKLPLAQWRLLGVRNFDGGDLALEDTEMARLWLPADASGPKYLLTGNFDTFLEYNRSLSYAFAVGLLADGIAGRAGPQAPWPTHLARVSVADMTALQSGLNALGFEAGTADGIMGSRTRRALQRFQSERGLVADGYPTPELVAQVIAAAG